MQVGGNGKVEDRFVVSHDPSPYELYERMSRMVPPNRKGLPAPKGGEAYLMQECQTSGGSDQTTVAERTTG